MAKLEKSHRFISRMIMERMLFTDETDDKCPLCVDKLQGLRITGTLGLARAAISVGRRYLATAASDP